MSAFTNVLRTEGVIVDAILGNGEALDGYSKNLQEAAIQSKAVENRMAAAEARTRELANEILAARDATAADVYARLFPCCPDVEIAAVMGAQGTGGGSAPSAVARPRGSATHNRPRGSV
jgi:hypothetical protein